MAPALRWSAKLVVACFCVITLTTAGSATSTPTLAHPTSVEELHRGLKQIQQGVRNVLLTAHERGLVGVLHGFLEHNLQQGNSPREVAWDTVGSTPDKSAAVNGYSTGFRIKTGAVTQQIDADNNELTSKILSALSMDGWTELANKESIQVLKRPGTDVQVGSYPKGVGAKPSDRSQLLCLFSRGEIDAPLDKVYSLFLTNDYVRQYNALCQECRDVGWLDEATKITWATSRNVGPIYSRDFVTRCHYRKLRDGSRVIAQMSEQMSCEEFRSQGLSVTPYVRMEINFAGYVLRPLDGGARTEFNMLSLSNPGGVFDTKIGAAVANMMAAKGPIDFILAVRRLSGLDSLTPDAAISYGESNAEAHPHLRHAPTAARI